MAEQEAAQIGMLAGGEKSLGKLEGAFDFSEGKE
jgi:hypothetical protein